MAALPGYLCLVNLASGTTASTDLSLTDAGDHKTFTVPLNSPKRYIDRSATLVVQTTTDGSTWTTRTIGTDFTIRYLTAQVVLTIALSGGTSYGCRLHTFNYYPYAAIAQANDITLTANTNMLDTTVFQGSSGAGWMSFIPGVQGGSFACKSWMLASGATLYLAHMQARDLLILSFVAPNGTNAMEAYCYVEQTNWQSSVTTLAEEDLTFRCDSIVSLI